jgi:hypothetical protein
MKEQTKGDFEVTFKVYGYYGTAGQLGQTIMDALADVVNEDKRWKDFLNRNLDTKYTPMQIDIDDLRVTPIVESTTKS